MKSERGHRLEDLLEGSSRVISGRGVWLCIPSKPGVRYVRRNMEFVDQPPLLRLFRQNSSEK